MMESSAWAARSRALVLDVLSRYGDAVASRLYLQLVDLRDIAQIELLASEVLPHI